MRTICLIILLLSIPSILTSKTVRVKYVIDGDTFITQDDEKVRMLGINATEREEWFYQEAKDYLKDLIQGKEVELIPDTKSPDRDKHGRLLRYAHLGGMDVNKEMILEGYTYAFLRYKIDRNSEYAAAERQATKAKLGLWSNGQRETTSTGTDNYDNESSSYLIFGILGFIALVMVVQTWRYFR